MFHPCPLQPGCKTEGVKNIPTPSCFLDNDFNNNNEWELVEKGAFSPLGKEKDLGLLLLGFVL